MSMVWSSRKDGQLSGSEVHLQLSNDISSGWELVLGIGRARIHGLPSRN